jgi:hypothetical protein
MKFVGKCRDIENRVPDCRHIQVQRSIASNLQRTTTRLSESKMPGFNLGDLRRNNIDIIKGLLVLADVSKAGCVEAQPLIVFGKPIICGQKADYQHMDIASSLGLTERVAVPQQRANLIGAAFEKRLLPGVYGFSISPIQFSSETAIAQSQVEFPLSGDRICRVKVAESKVPGMVNGLNGEVDLNKLRRIEEKTAQRFWEQNVYAFLFRANQERDKEVWAVYASSGAGGNIPNDGMSIFLDALARHVAPEFMVFQFLAVGGTFVRNRVAVSWARAKRPNCLEWPSRIRLLHGPVPDNWWGDQV